MPTGRSTQVASPGPFAASTILSETIFVRLYASRGMRAGYGSDSSPSTMGVRPSTTTSIELV